MQQGARRRNTGHLRKRLKVEAATSRFPMSLSEDDKLQFKAPEIEILEVNKHINSYCEECCKGFKSSQWEKLTKG
jgi:hypothetical protein